MEGPPISIFSIIASWSAPDATVSAKGYRFTTTRSKGSTSSSLRVSICSCLRRSAKIPAWMRGCRVFTRPSRHSGNSVTSVTSVTGTPAAAIVDAVEPVDTSFTPASCRPRANSARLVLSYTEMRARRRGRRSSFFIDTNYSVASCSVNGGVPRGGVLILPACTGVRRRAGRKF